MALHIYNSTLGSPFPNSPASSSSTLALEDDEVKALFEADRLKPTHPHPSDFSGIPPGNGLPDTAELNPHAPPFVPHPHSPKPPKSRCLLRPPPDEMLQPRIPRWLRNLQIAGTPLVDKSQKALALIIVNSEAWEPETMADLIQHICWEVAEASPEDLDALITLSKILYMRFRGIKGELFADSFLWHLRELVIGTFISAWDASFNPEAISYHPTPSKQYVSAAIRLGIFIGELSKQNIFDGKDMDDCFEILVSNFVSVEHADAIQAFLHHAGPTYWFHHPDGLQHLRHFGSAIASIGQKLKGEMSVLDEVRSEPERQALLESICVCCREWSDQMVEMKKQTPRPDTDHMPRNPEFLYQSVPMPPLYR